MYIANIKVMLKPDVKDPQGEMVARAIWKTGIEDVDSVRVGKLFVTHFEAGSTKEAEQKARDMCEKILCNPIIEASEFEVVRASR